MSFNERKVDTNVFLRKAMLISYLYKGQTQKPRYWFGIKTFNNGLSLIKIQHFLQNQVLVPVPRLKLMLLYSTLYSMSVFKKDHYFIQFMQNLPNVDYLINDHCFNNWHIVCTYSILLDRYLTRLSNFEFGYLLSVYRVQYVKVLNENSLFVDE